MGGHLTIKTHIGMEALNAGLFVSRGKGTHPTRMLDSHELIFVREGVLFIREESTCFDVGRGHALILRAGREHGGVKPYAPDLSFYWMHFRIQKNNRFESTDCLSVSQFSVVVRPDRMTELFRYYLDDQESGLAVQKRSDLLLMLMLSEATADGSVSVVETPGNTLAFRARDRIMTHYAEPITTSLIARRLKCNPDYLGRVYRRVFGISITDAIQRRRISVGRRLLMDSVSNIDEIATACGFNGTHYFRKIFRKIEGMTPGSYRKLYSRVHVNTE